MRPGYALRSRERKESLRGVLTLTTVGRASTLAWAHANVRAARREHRYADLGGAPHPRAGARPGSGPRARGEPQLSRSPDCQRHVPTRRVAGEFGARLRRRRRSGAARPRYESLQAARSGDGGFLSEVARWAFRLRSGRL